MTDTALLLSPDVGIVHRLDEGVTGYDHPRLAPAFAQTCDVAPLFGIGHEARAGGMGTELSTARHAALGEAVERYSACHVPTSRVSYCPSAELDGPRVPPLWIEPPVREPAAHWVPGTRLGRPGEPAWVAVSRAYLRHLDDGLPTLPPTSSGLACHPDPWQALQSGLLEVIERDAVMATWLSRGPVTPIASALRWRTAAGAEVRFDRAIETYRLFLLPSPLAIPVVFAVALGAERQPAAAVGAAAHLDVATACRKALIEAAQTFHWATAMRAAGRRADDPSSFDDFDDHVAHYLEPARLAAFRFLLDSDAPALSVDLQSADDAVPAEAATREVVARAGASGMECFAVDVTSPDVRVAGLWVVRAIVPGLAPLLVGAAASTFRHPRLPATAERNPDPHPFP